MSEVVPAGNRLSIIDLPAEEKAGLILPPGVAGRPDVGIVQAVGDDVRLDISVGDKVFYCCNVVEVEDVKIIDGGCVIAIERSPRPF